MKWLKNALYVLLAVLLVGGGFTYFKLKEIGIIPRAVYETEPPPLPEFQRPALLVLSKANGFVHVDAIPAAQAMLRRIAARRGWDIYVTDNAATHNARDLEKFAAVVWNNVSGDVLTGEQRAALRDWIEAGGGWLGIHGAGGDPSYQWDWYVDTLIGAQFVGHTMDPQFQDAAVLVADPQAAITAHLPTPWTVPSEEWYAFDSNPRARGYDILLTLDEDSYITKGRSLFGNDRMEGEHPIAWRHEPGRGRVLYSAIGHQAATYELPAFEQLIENALSWVGALD
ncbi:MAG: glycosyl hydrolase [Halioglobus sp.]|nr:glycosyl hydrolase [Halioglobus sp.]|tara:strand:- start:1252 stop:2100 length:849 start_codon:yes stop_codon:yes gene_type:complete